jgi:glycogen operon protein
LQEFTKELITLRRENAALRPEWFRHPPGTGVEGTVELFRADAREFEEAGWTNPDARSAMFVLGHSEADSFALLLNAAGNGVEFALPKAPAKPWELAISSDPDQEVGDGPEQLIVRDHSFTLLRSRSA